MQCWPKVDWQYVGLSWGGMGHANHPYVPLHFFLFLFDEVDWEGFFSKGEAMPLVLLKAASSVCLIGSAPHASCFNADTILSATMLSEQS